jgi:hypothetical protein
VIDGNAYVKYNIIFYQLVTRKPPVYILGKINPVHDPPPPQPSSYFMLVHLNIILTPTAGFITVITNYTVV